MILLKLCNSGVRFIVVGVSRLTAADAALSMSKRAKAKNVTVITGLVNAGCYLTPATHGVLEYGTRAPDFH
jgi:hypothetical protein